MGAKIVYRMRFVGDHPDRRARLALEDLKRRQPSLFDQDNSHVKEPYLAPYQRPDVLAERVREMNEQHNRARQSKSSVGTRARRTASGARADFSKEHHAR